MIDWNIVWFGFLVWWTLWTAGTLRVLKIRDGYVELVDLIGWILVAWIAAPVWLVIQLVFWVSTRSFWKRRVL